MRQSERVVDVSARTRTATVRRVQRASGSLATRAVQRMEAELPWFATMPADHRSWIGLIAQAGIAAFAAWLRTPDAGTDLTGEVFASAPREMARAVTLEQTVELVRIAVQVVEEAVDDLAPEGAAGWLRDNVLRYSREIAFTVALVYARAAEERGAWDARLEALLVDEVLRGEPDDSLLSRAAALGWGSPPSVAVLVGTAPPGDAEAVIEAARRTARRDHTDLLAGVQGRRLVVLLGSPDPAASAAGLVTSFGAGPVVLGPTVRDLTEARASAAEALAALRAAPAWPEAPRPAAAASLLPERALDGDAAAQRALVEDVYSHLMALGDPLAETLSVYLETAGSLEATARVLFVHPNTVRYRLRRVAQECGLNPVLPRDAFVLRVALSLGRLGPRL
jgi:DNA-binding PucR family transcriptional regulator